MKITVPVLRRLLGLMFLVCLSSVSQVQAAAPLPDDLQLVPADSLPLRASWYSFTRWGKYPPSPANWCASRDDVLYYYSPSFGTSRIIIDDSLVEYLVPSQAALSPSLRSGTLGPTYGPDDIWLEIRFDTNLANNIDLILHNATNGFWQIESRTNVADPALPWTFLDADLVDTKGDLFFGPFPDTNPPQNFYRAARVAQPFEIVATNVPNPVAIDYSPAQQALILAVNYSPNTPNNFAILDTNSTLTAWSGISAAPADVETRLFTVKATADGLHAGDLLFGSSEFPPATIGWLAADGTTSNLTWAVLTDEPNIAEALYIDQTGVWSNDVLAVAAQDGPLTLAAPLNVWRLHQTTNQTLVCTIEAVHLEGILTLPDSPTYGPWAAKMLTADEQQRTIYAIATDGTFTTNLLNIGADCFRLVPESQSLYCIAFNQPETRILKLPSRLLRHHIGEVVVVQAGEVSFQTPAIFFTKWNGTSFQTISVQLRDYFPGDSFFEKLTFAPIDLPALQ